MVISFGVCTNHRASGNSDLGPRGDPVYERAGAVHKGGPCMHGWPAFMVAAMTSMACSRQPGTTAPSWEKRIQVASGEAQRGPWEMNESDYRWVDDPSVDVWANGEIAVAWADQSRKDIFFQRYGRQGERRFEQPAAVSQSPETFSWLPRVVVNPEDPNQVHVLWQEIVFSGGSHGGEIFFAASSDAGRTFSQPENLSHSKAGDGKGRLDREIWDNGSLDLARGPSGELYAAWTEYEGTLWFRRSTDGGKTFSTPLRIGGGDDAPARGPSLAVGGGSVHVAWAVGESRAADIQLASSKDGGTSFGPARAVCESPGHSDAPKIATNSEGTVHLVYAEGHDGPGKPHHIRYSRMKPGASGFEAPRAVAGSQADHAASAHYPQLAVDRAGSVFLLWEQYIASHPRPRGLAFTYSSDGGERFQPPSLMSTISAPALGFNGSQQGLLTKKLAVSQAGIIAIVNSTFRPDTASHVWLLRGRLQREELAD